VTAGIWRPVTLVAHTGPRIREVRTRTTMDGQVTFEIALAAALTESVAVQASVGSTVVSHEIGAGQGGATVTVRVPDPELWWPRGLGEAVLYDVEVCVGDDRWTDRVVPRLV
jgi:beta-mannosidase